MSDEHSGVFPDGVKLHSKGIVRRRGEDHQLSTETSYANCEEALYQNGAWECVRKALEACRVTRHGPAYAGDAEPAGPCLPVPASGLFTYTQDDFGAPQRVPASPDGNPIWSRAPQSTSAEGGKAAPAFSWGRIVVFFVVGAAIYWAWRKR